MNRRVYQQKWMGQIFARLAPWRAPGLIALSWIVLFSALGATGARRYAEDTLARPVEVRVRDMLGRGPILSDRLKIFALDDSTAAVVGSSKLSLSQTNEVIRALGARKPRMIIVDSLFSTANDPEHDLEVFRAMRRDGINLAGGVFVTGKAIKYRNQLQSSVFGGNFESYHPQPERFAPLDDRFIYGPSAGFLPGFFRLGHILQTLNSEFIPVFAGAVHGLPHIGLLPARKLSVSGRSLLVDDAEVIPDRDGVVPVNFVNPASLYRRVMPLRRIFESQNDITAKVSEGDIVLIIFTYGTGNTDFLESPWGKIPGGFFIASAINSTLTGAWLRRWDGDVAVTVVLGVAGVLIGHFSGAAVFWGIIAFCLGALFTMAQVTFIWTATFIPWVLPSFCMIASSLSAYARQRYLENKVRLRLEVELATASALQQNFLPPDKADDPRFEIAIGYQPADSIGGDWYSYAVFKGRWLHLMLGDVTGHGTPAALFASFAKGATDMIFDNFQNSESDQLPVADVHASLNRLLGGISGEMSFMTLISVAVDLETGEAVCLSSGHPPAYALAGDGQSITSLTSRPGGLLGFDRNSCNAFPSRFQVADGATLVIHSDGLFDVATRRGVRMNDRRFKAVIRDLAGLPPLQMRRAVLERLNLLDAGSSDRIDDVTLIIVRLRIPVAASRGSEPAQAG